MVVALLHDIC